MFISFHGCIEIGFISVVNKYGASDADLFACLIKVFMGCKRNALFIISFHFACSIIKYAGESV